jgi:hypothetical protein
VAADLRQQIADYFGPGGTNIEIVCTENNSNSGSQGKQSTSLVNAVYLADNLGRVLATEFNSYIWWDLRNGADTGGNMDPTLYGWRTVGDLGMIGGATNRYPDFYALKLMRQFASPGDAVLPASSDYLLVSAYAIRRADGAVNLLLLNKDTQATFNAQVSLSGFAASPNAEMRSYGMPQDNAAETSSGSQDISSTNVFLAGPSFNAVLPPLSLALLTLSPQAPLVAALAFSDAPGSEIVLQIQGQPGLSYVVQSSPDLANWTDVSTNTSVAGAMSVTNTIPSGAGREFWRAVWRP